MTPTLRIILFSLPLFAAGALAPAVSAAAENETEKWYEVEIVVFAHQEGDALHSEQWLADPGAPATENNVQHLTPAGAPAASAPVAKSGAVAFQALSPNELKLTPLADKLRSSASYHVMAHTGWRLPAPKGERGVNVYIDAKTGAAPSAEATKDAAPASPFFGIVNVTLTRYLHLGVDLVYRQPELLRAVNNVDTSAPSFLMGGDKEKSSAAGATPSAPVTGFRMTEKRRIKLEQLQYFDHPLFGAIARVVPYDAGKPAKN